MQENFVPEWIGAWHQGGMTIDGTIMMTLGEKLKQYVREPRTQKVIALTWLEEMRKLGKEWSASHIESQLSRCLNDQLPAARFFFGERDQGRALLRVLEVPELEFDQFLQLADETLIENGARPARLIIDLTPWSRSVDARKLFEALRVAFIDPKPLEPAVLLVTRSQYDDLPRSFDREDEWLEVRCVDGQLDLEQLDASALIASPTPPKDIERWLAMELDRRTGALVLEPHDGLVRYGQHGKLSLPPIASSLADFVDDRALPAPRAPSGPIERRRWMDQLRTENTAAKVAPDPRMRLAIARSLGIEATATEQDRIEHEIAEAAARLVITGPKVGSAEDLDALLHRAGRYPTGETVLRVGNELHVVNPLAERDLAGGRVRVHRVASKIPAIRRLLAAIENWTIGDYESDPFLLRVIEQLGADKGEYLALLHARTTLVRSKLLRPKLGSPINDWRGAVQRSFQLDPPQTLLGIPNRDHVYQSPMPVWMTAALHSIPDEDANILRFTPSPLEQVVIERDKGLHIVREKSSPSSYYVQHTNFVLVDNQSIEGQPGDGGQNIIERRWIDALDAFIEPKSSSPAGAPRVTLNPSELPSNFWADADYQAALLWLALRNAASAPAVRRHDGAVMLRLGRGLGIIVQASETAQPMPPAAILTVGGRDQAELMKLVDTGLRRGDYETINICVPKGLTVHHERTRLRIDVIASPLLGLALTSAAVVDDDRDDSDDDD
jgi:hypothetical protein